MNGDDAPLTTAGWDQNVCQALIDELWALREHMLATEHAFSERLLAVSEPYRPSARNLAHYLALRQEDRRPLQEKLAWLGLSSLGNSESHVLANLDKVLGILHRLTGQTWSERSLEEPAGIRSSHQLLGQHTATLLGAQPPGRTVRIMVTLPSEAALDYGLVHHLVAAGMDIARINCAHDDAGGWSSMATHVRRAAQALGRPVRILMDLGGPKLRTGLIPPAPAVLKLQPTRDTFGRVTRKACLGLRAFGSTMPVGGASAHIAVSPDWLARLEAGDRLDLVDARDAHRRLTVLKRDGAGVLCECRQTTYFVPETRLERRRQRHGKHHPLLAELPSRPSNLLLRQGDLLRLTRAMPAGPDQEGPCAEDGAMLSISCTLPEVFTQVCIGERIFFDDGRIGGVIRKVDSTALTIEIVQASREGSRLAGDKGINLPDSQLDLPALTEKDIEDLSVVARHADLVGLSFVQRGSDIDALRSRLAALGAHQIGVILKIETRRAFENLPELLLSAMASRTAGVMIARGDLAVECGYERLAEVQEEILWATEAAHMPVIWATQVLETLAKTGQPSRAEITDAAMGERAECVMLNKGPYILDAMRVLDDILKRMQSHQAKKRSLLRALAAWTPLPQRLP
jgi:pyruvate kinase